MFRNLRIAPEGYGIITFAFIICLLFNILTIYFNLAWLSLIANTMIFLFVGTCFFFRDPKRKISRKHQDFLSPADGTILSVKNYQDAKIGDAKKISIFLSVLNVHRQWVPLNSKVVDTHYNPGTFFGAFLDKASEKNEQTSIYFSDNENNIYRIKQIAGFVARRIVNHMNPNSDVIQGENLGFIKFGSRVEIIVPSNFKVNVKKGMKVKGCKTIIGKFN
tara:strand:- start:2438 stop:3094 length:657 start_codon:yes stop_codon:yes gene_type:complete